MDVPSGAWGPITTFWFWFGRTVEFPLDGLADVRVDQHGSSGTILLRYGDGTERPLLPGRYYGVARQLEVAHALRDAAVQRSAA